MGKTTILCSKFQFHLAVSTAMPALIYTFRYSQCRSHTLRGLVKSSLAYDVYALRSSYALAPSILNTCRPSACGLLIFIIRACAFFSLHFVLFSCSVHRTYGGSLPDSYQQWIMFSNARIHVNQPCNINAADRNNTKFPSR